MSKYAETFFRLSACESTGWSKRGGAESCLAGIRSMSDIKTPKGHSWTPGVNVDPVSINQFLHRGVLFPELMGSQTTLGGEHLPNSLNWGWLIWGQH